MSVPSVSLHVADCLQVLSEMDSGCVDLVYLDPPYNSGRDFGQFNDRWTWDDHAWNRLADSDCKTSALLQALLGTGSRLSYLTFMEQRLRQLRRVLAPNGSLYLHCDPTMSHYLKVVLDAIFGPARFRNEIVWCYMGPSAARRNFPGKHDVILRYSKGGAWTFNADAIRVPYKSPVHAKGTSAIWAEKAGTDFAAINARGKVPEDWMADTHLANVGAWAKERTGYPTQKPLELLDRIIRASSNPGDLVLDPFCGCGTTLMAAQRLGRRWIGIDSNPAAIAATDRRGRDMFGLFWEP